SAAASRSVSIPRRASPSLVGPAGCTPMACLLGIDWPVNYGSDLALLYDMEPPGRPDTMRDMKDVATFRVKAGLAEMLKGGVIMDVVTAEEAKIAEQAGAAAVMALERVPADIRADGGVARMADPTKIDEIKEAVTIPVMAKARIGHFAEAQVLEA